MYKVTTDRANAIVEFVLDGVVSLQDMQDFVVQMEKATVSLVGREIKVKADVRGFKPGSPEVASMIRGIQEFGIKNGVKRVAELVESEIVALQLNRVARESGTDKILRRFWEDDSAREWLINGDPKS